MPNLKKNLHFNAYLNPLEPVDTSSYLNIYNLINTINVLLDYSF